MAVTSRIILALAVALFGIASFLVADASSAHGISSKKLVVRLDKTDLRDGDLVFQTSLSGQGQAIQLATNSPWSHVGMIFHLNGEPWVYEAIQPVRFTRLAQFTGRGKDGGYTVKRLKNASEVLTPAAIEKMLVLARKHEGKNYDMAFNWSDKEMYCSEVAWKIYEQVLGIRLGEPRPMRTYDLSHPIVKATMQQRYGNNLPLDEPMISPGVMYDSELLETVFVKS